MNTIQPNNGSDFLLYTTPNGAVKFDVFVQHETVWLTQKQLAELFEVSIPTINEHLQNIFSTHELDEKSVIRNFRITAVDGKTYETKHYNLDAIISVGYRVNSTRATQFRIWATQVLREYIIKGFAMNDERLKNPQTIFGKDYFEEQLARIRDIRSSERRFYQKIADIYAACSADYDSNTDITKEFFATVQNKLHFAISGHTAAEIIHARVDSTMPNMGLTTWKNAPKGAIRKTDVGIAKNYLNTQEMDELNRIVTMYLDYADAQARKGMVMYMKDWIEKLNAFLQFNEKEILESSGTVSHEVALALAEKEYNVYQKIQDANRVSDFDIELQRIQSLQKPA